MDDHNMQDLLKWSIENSASSREQGIEPSGRKVNEEALARMLGAPSDAELMKASMHAIQAPLETISLENKMVAFDNFEQLVESVDNANDLENLKLWSPLIEQLSSPEPQLRLMAAWCVGTAVQNNPRAQAVLVQHQHHQKVFDTLVDLALHETDSAGKRKAVYALSSAVRNFQPAMDVLLASLPEGTVQGKVDATDMDAVNSLMDTLRGT